MTTIFDEIRAKRESPEEAEYRERERQRELRELTNTYFTTIGIQRIRLDQTTCP